MKTLKNKILTIILLFVILTIYNITVFFIPFSRTFTFWISYAFTNIAILLTAGICFYTFGHEGIRSRLSGLFLFQISWIYLIIQLILGLVCMSIPVLPYWVALVLSMVCLGMCVIFLIAADFGKQEIDHEDIRIKNKINYIRSLQTKVENILIKAEDNAIKQMLKNLAETIRYSDPMSSDKLVDIEENISNKVVLLEESINAGNYDSLKLLFSELQQLISERNNICIKLK